MSKRRRGNNEGSIYRRKDGRWTASINLGYVAGKRKRKSVYGATRKEVAEQLNKLSLARQQGLPLGSDKLTTGEWLDRWLHSVEPPNTKPKTYTAYEYQIRVHLKPALGRIQLDKLQPDDVRRFIREKLDAGLAPKTVRHFRATLRAAFNVAVGDGIIPRNVVSLVKAPPLTKKVLAVLDRRQALNFLEIARTHRLGALFTAAISIGLREGEVLGLQWRDVDLESGVLTVNHTLQRVKPKGHQSSKLMLLEPKTQKSRRQIKLPQVLIAALVSHRETQDRERILAGERWVETGMVFTTSVGTMLDQRSMLRSFSTLLSAASLPRIRFHDLRHSAATLLLAQGVHPRAIMELLGHSSITLTMNTYAHVLDELKAKTADSMDAIFDSMAVNSAVIGPSRKVH